jgi:hypothetical protein
MKRRGDVGGGWSAFAGMLVACAAVAAGCGPKGLTVSPTSGTVTYKGKPVAGALVQFMPEKGSPCDGRTDDSGKYTILYRGKPGAPVGPCRVTVSKPASSDWSQGMSDTTPEDLARLSAANMAKKPAPPPKDKNAIPAKYSTVEKSGLKVVVTSDASKNVFDFNLED